MLSLFRPANCSGSFWDGEYRTGRRRDARAVDCPGGRKGYFSEALIEVNFLLSVVPRLLTAVMIASAMPAAISAYSIAVAPDSSARNCLNRPGIGTHPPICSCVLLKSINALV